MVGSIVPHEIHVSDAMLDDLHARLGNTRWPRDAAGEPWGQGTAAAFLRPLVDYWASGFDWRAQERRLNTFSQWQADIDGLQIHFVHARAGHDRALPLLLTHGWPSAFVEYLPLVELLPEHDLVIPSLPGYGFSERPPTIGVNYRAVARIWHSLMERLGYERYGVGGGDFGAGVATLLALDYPKSVIGVHLTNFEIPPPIGEGSAPITPEEQAYLDYNTTWWVRERGYKEIQSTKPQTLAYALTDSPVGLAAWILEKWRSWSDCGGDLIARFDRDFLLTLVTIYWVTGSIGTSIRDYFDNRWFPVPLGPDDRVNIPTAFASFPHQYSDEGQPPRSFVERLYRVTRWTEMPRGGHFAPAEEPHLVAQDIRAFFAELR